MAMLRQWLLVWLALSFCAGRLIAASGEENLKYRAATNSLALGFWERAERELAEFLAVYPTSEYVPEAVLRQAQAQFKLRKFGEVIGLLTASQPRAGGLVDQYLYWLAEAQFQSTQFAVAAENFGKVARTSTNSAVRLEASVREAASLARLDQWEQAAELLRKPDGMFRQAIATNPEGETAARGLLLLAEAELALRRFAEAEAALTAPSPASLKPELAWQRQFLLCKVQFAAGRTNEALYGTTNLLALAETTARRELLPESIAFRAELLERHGRLDEAEAAYGLNLTTNAPPDRQRQALVKLAQLALTQNRLNEAIQRIEQFLQQFSNAPATDVALLTLGELFLKQSPPLVSQALTNFDRLITFSNSAHLGKAQLGRGWCFWISTNFSASAEAFKIAVERLPPSEDLAIARFKLADALFAQKDYAGALQNYRLAQDIAAGWPRVKDALTAQSLYQVLRSSLESKDVAGATNAMRQILQSYPNQPEADRGVLLVGQGFADLNEPEPARALFGEFIEKFPESELRPEVELALAHTLEQKTEWLAAVELYEKWLVAFPTNRLRPQAEFYRALANFRAGHETNAFTLFTNFVAQFPASDLAPKAQRWVADYFFNQGEAFYEDAEKNYKKLFQDWPDSSLAREARMMAGRAAIGRNDYLAAIEHFTSLTSDTNAELRIQALLAYGSAQMALDTGATNRAKNLQSAIEVFNTIHRKFPATESAVLAWGEIGKCYFQLAAYDARHYESASNAFQQVLVSPMAGFAARSQAKVGLGRLAEAQAGQKVGTDRVAWLKQALNYYLDAFFYEKILRAGEQPDWGWVKYAGQEAARVAEALDEWSQALNLYRRLQQLLPALQPSLEKKIARAEDRLAAEKN